MSTKTHTFENALVWTGPKTKQQLCTRITLFVHFFIVTARLRRENEEIFFPFFQNFDFVLRNTIPEEFACSWQSKRVGIIAIEIERTRSYFLSDVFAALADVVSYKLSTYQVSKFRIKIIINTNRRQYRALYKAEKGIAWYLRCVWMTGQTKKLQKVSLQFIHHFIQKFYCSAKTILWREGFVASLSCVRW